jgi:hypothetical protein
MNLSSIFRPFSQMAHKREKLQLERCKEIHHEATTGQLDGAKISNGMYQSLFQKMVEQPEIKKPKIFSGEMPPSTIITNPKIKKAASLILDMQVDTFILPEGKRFKNPEKALRAKNEIDRVKDKLEIEGKLIFPFYVGYHSGGSLPQYLMPMHDLSDPRICEVLEIVSEYQIERLTPRVQDRAMKLGIAA